MDKSCILDEYPVEDTKVNPNKVKYSLGGPVPAALIVLSRLGVDCTLYASVGEDREGQLLLKKLAQEGVRLIGEKKKMTKVNTYIINKQNGSRTGIKSEVVYSPLKRVPLDVLKESDVIIADRHESKALDFAYNNKRTHTKIIVDPSTEVSKKAMKIIRQADIPIVPIETLDLINKTGSRMENLKVLCKMIRKPLLITAGEYGSLLYDNGKLLTIPALDVQAVDRLGAGDVYRAGIAWGVLQKWSLDNCAKFANVVSGLQCTRYGNGTAIPSREEIERMWVNPKFKKETTNVLNI